MEKLKMFIKKCMGKPMHYYIIAVICLLLFAWGGTVFCDVLGIGFKAAESVLVDIPEAAGISRIAQELKNEGIIKSTTAFKIISKLGPKDRVYQQGGHYVNANQSYAELLRKISDKPDVWPGQSVRVLIPEGYEIRHIAKTLADAGLVDEEKFLQAAENDEFDFEFLNEIERKENRLEGYLFPDTYDFDLGMTEHEIIEHLLETFEKKILPLYENADTQMSLDEVLTMASMIEREAANDSERGKISSVFYNRLERNMTLSSCATVQYILKERKNILSNSDIKIESGYNTYINHGLPIGPIASVGVASFKAALYPEDTEYLYFAARLDGSENIFSKTGEEHLATVKRLQGK